jgi:hypothetical protein
MYPKGRDYFENGDVNGIITKKKVGSLVASY